MPSFDRLDIPDLLVQEMIDHARNDLPNECCGLLAGRVQDGVGLAISRFPIANDEASPREYFSNARDMLFAFRAMRESGQELLAIYHSHPTSEPVPSKRDVEQNTYGESVIHVIVSLATPQAVIRAWWLTETGYREEAWSVTLREPGA
jgi:[CysO sulfur-carrier protein]-S-L-cysteine hydrolase